jgi:hypothetical protein
LKIFSDKLFTFHNIYLLQHHLHITLPLPLTTMEIFKTVQNFVTEKKIGEVMWMNPMKQMNTSLISQKQKFLGAHRFIVKENDKMEMGIVMLKEHADETMKKIKEHPEFHRDRFGGERNNGCALYLIPN